MKDFIDTLEQSSSFYGLHAETLNSLILTFLPSGMQDSVHGMIPVIQSGETSAHDELHQKLAYMMNVLLTVCNCHSSAQDLNGTAVTTALCLPNVSYIMISDTCMRRVDVFFFWQMDSSDVCDDAKCIISQLQSYKQMLDSLKTMSYSSIRASVMQAICALHQQDNINDNQISEDLSIHSRMVIVVLQQWLVRISCKRIMQLMTPEALVQHRRKMPSSYIMHYLNEQHHFNLKNLVVQQYNLCKSSKLHESHSRYV